MFPTGLFETATQRRILRVLAEKNRKYTSEELAEACHRTKPTVSRALQHVERYPFVSQETASESKQKLYTLDSESEYSTPIREFFRTERRRERRDGTVPVDVWNLLEEITNTLDGKVDSFLELVLFGSYARGDYHAGSDLDLLLVYTDPEEDVKVIADYVIESLGVGKEVQILTGIVEKPPVQQISSTELAGRIRELAPVSETEPLIPLSGSVDL